MSARVIPFLTIKNGSLVKSIKFKDHKYLGDPINAVRIFNEKEVDEIVIVDISRKFEPDYEIIKDIVSEAFVPVAYGGSVSNLAQMKKLFKLGVEKILINSIAFSKPEIIREAVSYFGSQSIVVVVDYTKPILGKYIATIEANTKKTKYNPLTACLMAEEMGAGEIILQSIDRDGGMQGYDLETISEIATKLNIPLIPLGGCGKFEHIVDLIATAKVQALAASSFFVYHGPYKAVLIKYLSESEKNQL